MAERTEILNEPASSVLVVTRVINAPRALVFKAWTEPEHLINWWGPKGFTNTFQEINVKPGGVWRFIMHGPDGVDYPNQIVFTEIVKPLRIAYTHGCGESNDESEFKVSVDFEKQGGQTKLTMRLQFASSAIRDQVIRESGAIQAAGQTLDNLEAELSVMSGEIVTDEVFSVTRVLDAPRELVYKVWTEPAHLAHWWGPKGFKLTVAHLDLRPGGVFHYGMKADNGIEMWGRFVYREIVAPEKMVFVISFSDAAGNITRHPLSEDWPLEVLTVLTLTEQDGKTILQLSSAPLNASEREQEAYTEGFKSMQQGFAGTFEQLEAYLLELN